MSRWQRFCSSLAYDEANSALLDAHVEYWWEQREAISRTDSSAQASLRVSVPGRTAQPGRIGDADDQHRSWR